MKNLKTSLLVNRMVGLGLISSSQAISMSSEAILKVLIQDCVSGEAKVADLVALVNEGLRQRREFKVNYTPYLWCTLEDILLAQNFKAEFVSRIGSSVIKTEVTSKDDSNVNVVYRREDVPYVIIILESFIYDIKLPLLMDKEDYDALSLKDNGKRTTVFFRTGSGSRDGELRFQMGYTKLHRSVIMRHKEDFNIKNDVDHVAVSPSICTSEYLREATHAQNNSYHIVTPCRISADKLSFTYSSGSEAVIQAIKKLMENEEYKSFTYKVAGGKAKVESPQYSSEAEMYEALAKFEGVLFGEFRYDPIIACPKSISVFLMILWKIGVLSYEEYQEARIFEYECRGELEMLKYYQVI